MPANPGEPAPGEGLDSFKKPYADAGHDIESLFQPNSPYKCSKCGSYQIDLSEDLVYGEMRRCTSPPDEVTQKLIERLLHFGRHPADERARGRIGSYIECCNDAASALASQAAEIGRITQERDFWKASAFEGDRQATKAERDLAEAREAGHFLLDRLVDHEVRMTSDEDASEWYGHVTPAMARFRQALASEEGR